MPAPKGTRTSRFHVNGTDDVHVYSDVDSIRLQLRRHVPTQQDIDSPSFKVALTLTSEQAIAIAGELLTAATCHGHPTNQTAPPQEVGVTLETERNDAAPSDLAPANNEPPHPPTWGRPWTEAEEEHLLECYDGGMSIPQLAKTHQRSLWGVQARLVKRGRLTLEQCQIFDSESLPATMFPQDLP